LWCFDCASFPPQIDSHIILTLLIRQLTSVETWTSRAPITSSARNSKPRVGLDVISHHSTPLRRHRRLNRMHFSSLILASLALIYSTALATPLPASSSCSHPLRDGEELTKRRVGTCDGKHCVLELDPYLRCITAYCTLDGTDGGPCTCLPESD